MFRGRFTYTVDAKGRVPIPAKLRKHFSAEADNKVVMTRSGKCIDLYPLDEWMIFENELRKLNQYNPEHALFQRTVLQYASEDEMDSQSRISIPKELRELVGIDKDILIIGMINKIELWSPVVFQEYMTASPVPFEQLAEKVMAK